MTPGDLTGLARQAQAGDRRACHALFEELLDSVRRHIYFVLGSNAIADEAVGETMKELCRALPGYRSELASPRTWALAIATRTAHRVRAKEWRYELVDDGTVDVDVFDVAPAAAAELVMLRRALATLTPKKRDAFVLMAIFELSAEEAGAMLDIPANTAASQYRHARKELRARLERLDRPRRAETKDAAGTVEP